MIDSIPIPDRSNIEEAWFFVYDHVYEQLLSDNLEGFREWIFELIETDSDALLDRNKDKWKTKSIIKHLKKPTGKDSIGMILAISMREQETFRFAFPSPELNPTEFTKHLRCCLGDRTLNKEKILSCMFRLMMKTNMRVGNERYAEENNTFGLTTLQKKHLVGDKLCFTGKSGVQHKISISGLCPRSKEVMLELWKKCRSSSSVIFPYNHLDMNGFLKTWMGGDYTCKDFRTFFSNKEFIRSFMRERLELPKDPSKGALKSFILRCIDDSAKKLGHTRSISRKSYISEELMDFCLEQWPKARRATYSKLLDVACS